LNINPHHEHEFEAAPGLPEPLPANERLLWQGAPQWRLVAVHVFHVRTLAWYFAAMMLLQATYLLGEPEPHVFKPLLLSLVLSVMALSILSRMAWLTARPALYTLTNKRVVMRIGVVLTLTFNLPLRMLASEITREKLFERLHDELPYRSTVETNEWKTLNFMRIRGLP